MLPDHFPNEVLRGDLAHSGVVLGDMDERYIGYYDYLGVFWSPDAISITDVWPADAYENKGENGHPNVLYASGMTATVTVVQVKVTKPCGRLVQDDFQILRFQGASSRYYAVCGLLHKNSLQLV